MEYNQVYRNTPDAHRQYQGMVFQGRYQVTNHWTMNGQYTLQLQNEGNFAGEGTNTPGATSRIGDYPEAYASEAQRFFPDGRLDSFQRHRVRAWTIYNVGMGRAGDMSFSGLWRIDSGGTYSLLANNQPLTTIQRNILANAGYRMRPMPRRSTSARAARRNSPPTACSMRTSATTSRLAGRCGHG